MLTQFGYTDTCKFFEELGLILKERQGYVYPISDQASTVLDIIRMELEGLRITVLLEEKVSKIVKKKNGFYVKTDKSTAERTGK